MTARGSDASQARSLSEQVTESLFHDFASDLGNGLGERNILGANLNTILGITALVNASLAYQSGQSLAFKRLSGGVRIEESDL